MKPSAFWLSQARSAFLVSKIATVRDGDPLRLHNRLRKAARLRGYLWRFAQDGRGGVVIKCKG